MFKINTKLLPIKAHYFFFMGAMGPILPQLSVLGKQIGISADVMGYIMSVLPIIYVVAKPLFGFIADYFIKIRKLIFTFLIITMSSFYMGFYFIPQIRNSPIDMDNKVWNMTLTSTEIPSCNAQALANSKLCTARKATCLLNISNSSDLDESVMLDFENCQPFVAYFMQTESLLNFIKNNMSDPQFCHFCHANISSVPVSLLNMTCSWASDIPDDCIYGTVTFYIFILFLCVGTIGFNITNSISDAICFDMLGESKVDSYGVQRVWGTVGFGVTALAAGYAVDAWTVGEVKSFTPALFVMLIFSGFDILSTSKLQLPKLTSSESILKDVFELMMHPSIVVFLVFTTIAGIIDSFIAYFLFWHVENIAAETGYMHQIKFIEGCVVAAECLAGEIPFFFYSGKIIKKLGYVHCMSMCFFFYAVRMALISWIPNPWYLVGVELFFQGCTYALCYTCIVAYASAIAPPGTSATVQGLIAGMDDGLGFSIGSLIGGLAFKRFGGRRSFMYFSIVALATCLAHIIIRPSSRKRQYLPKVDYHVPQEQNVKIMDSSDETLKT